jgi:hypothetical protein
MLSTYVSRVLSPEPLVARDTHQVTTTTRTGTTYFASEQRLSYLAGTITGDLREDGKCVDTEIAASINLLET